MAKTVHATGHGHYQWWLGKNLIMKQKMTVPESEGIVDLRSRDAVERDDRVGSSDNVTLLGAEHEAALLKTRLLDVEEALNRAQRRIERLLGERNQLGSLLDRRDEQIQRLNRELGTQRIGDPEEALPSTKASSWRQLFSRLRTGLLETSGYVQRGLKAGRSPKQAKQARDQSLSEGFKRPPLIAHYKTVEPKAVLAILLFGLDDGEIKNLLPVIKRDCTASDMMPLLLTDNDSFELLREHGIIFEYLPPLQDRKRFDQNLSWSLYLQRRLAIIRQKWQPARVIAFGQVAAETLRLWQQSPFEESPLPSAIDS